MFCRRGKPTAARVCLAGTPTRHNVAAKTTTRLALAVAAWQNFKNLMSGVRWIMIRYALRCDCGHEFDRWFDNMADYDARKADGGIDCPSCGGTKVAKAIMAPNVGKKDAPAPLPPSCSPGGCARAGCPAMMQ